MAPRDSIYIDHIMASVLKAFVRFYIHSVAADICCLHAKTSVFYFHLYLALISNDLNKHHIFGSFMADAWK